MGTRGIHGFLINGRLKVTYNQFDMYPTGVGAALVKELKEFSLASVKAAAKRIRLVKEDGKPSKKNQVRYADIADTGVAEKSFASWYCLLRRCQGTIRPFITGEVQWQEYVGGQKGWEDYLLAMSAPVSHMTNGADFAADSLFCEWGYVINLDDHLFEVYRGFQTEYHDAGRFASKQARDDYFPIALVATFPLDNLPTPEDMERLEQLAYYDGEDEEDEEDNYTPNPEGLTPAEVGELARNPAAFVRPTTPLPEPGPRPARQVTILS